MQNQLIFERDVAIPPMRDGLELRGNVYRPSESGAYPVLMTVGPYGKDIHFQDFSTEILGDPSPFFRPSAPILCIWMSSVPSRHEESLQRYGSPFARGVALDNLAVLGYSCQGKLAMLD
jgi:hypothetical protein